MAWKLAEPSSILQANTAILISVDFRHPPLAGPSSETVRTLVENTGIISVSSIGESIFTSITPGLATFEVQGTLTANISASELRNQLTSVLSGQWNIFSVYVNWIKVSEWEFPRPSTQTAISLAAIAVISLIAIYLLWRLKIV